MTKGEKRNLRNGLLFVSPWIVGMSCFLLYPIFSSLYHSFCDYSVLERPVWIGVTNYLDLARDQVFYKSLWNTFFYAFFAIPLGLGISLILALLLNTKIRRLAAYRTIFFLPSLVPIVAMAMLWMWIFNGQYGVLNYFLSFLGIRAPAWLMNVHWSKPALIIMSFWAIGYSMVIFLAGLQDVPVSLYESAEIDGANFLHKIRHVTIPMISPVILFNVIMGIIWTFQIFARPYVMTPGPGGPARSTTFYTLYLFQTAFEDLRMGYASAMAWILFLIILSLTLLSIRLSRDRVYYAGVR
jgi:multiple sugar transport system permease protein